MAHGTELRPGLSMAYNSPHQDCPAVPVNREGWLNVPSYLRMRQNGRHFTDNVLKCIFLNENMWISFKIPLKFVPKGPINNIPVLVQIMAWRRPGDKPLYEPMLVFVQTHICVNRPQWVNTEAERKWPPFSRWHFQMYFLEWKLLNLNKKFHWNLFPEFQLTYIIPALVEIMAIIWINDGLIYWHKYASLCLSDLTHLSWDKMAAISQTTFSNAFLWIKVTFLFWFEFHWSSFLRDQLTSQHCFR